MRKMKCVLTDSKFQNFKRFEIPIGNQNRIRGGTNITNTDIGMMRIINDDLDKCFLKIKNLIEAEINDGSKDYDSEFIRDHVNKLIS